MEQEDNKKEFGSLLEDFLNKKIERRDFMKGLVALGLAGGLLNSWAKMAEAAPTQATKAVTAPRRAVESWDDEYDIIIAGTGAAGLATAIEAYDNGADNILILERNMEPGGSTRRCGGGIAGADSCVQREVGVRDSPEEFYKYLSACGMGFTDPELNRVFAYDSGKNIDWMINDLGAETSMNRVVSGVPIPGLNDGMTPVMYEEFGLPHIPRVVWMKPAAPAWWGGLAGGTGIWEPLNRAVRARRIKTMLGMPMIEVVREEGYGVIGVKAGRGSRILNLKANKGVFLGTGGFLNNKEMMKNFMPKNYKETLAGLLIHPRRDMYFGKTGTTNAQLHAAHAHGDGIRLGQALGASLVNTWLISTFLMDTCGGLKIDTNARVIHAFGEPIPRLYAGGRTAGGEIGPYYPCCGTMIGTAICAGRIAGRNLAKEEDWHR